MQLEDKVVVVTGAGSEIGRGCAVRFAAEGAAVVVADINGAAADETADVITTAVGRAVPLDVDMTIPEHVERMMAYTVETFDRLDVLHNNATKGAVISMTRALALDLGRPRHPATAPDRRSWSTAA